MKWSTTSVLAIGLAICLASSAFAQPRGGGRGGPGGFGGGGFGGFGGGGGGGSLMLLFDENVRKDLGVTDDQWQRLQDGQRAMQERMAGAFQGLRDLSEEQRQARFEEIRKNSQDEQKKLENILTQVQRDRLKQIGIQSRLNRGNAADALAGDELAQDLGLTDADKDRIRKASDEAQDELRAEMRKLQDKAREKVIAALTPAQQAKLKQLTGAKIEFSSNGGGFGGFGGGRGGFGGGFGGGGFGGQGGAGGPGGRGPGGAGGRGPGGEGGRGPARPPVERLPDGD